MNKVAIAELITASAILFTISVFTITPFLLQNSPVLNKDEIRFKRVLINLTNNVEFHSESNLLPSLLFYPFSLLQESAELLTTTKFSLKSSKHFLFRFIPAFCSTLIAPIFCAILQIEGSSLLTAFSISLLLPLDSSFIIRSRFFFAR
ncbi:hypothetical protein TRFO_39897 [Tritrichomonas foetus]|uniref:ArnT-like N-terminal domain-containing protein n=1 Tax=Tritrichomonas foetus TaxID=1144522 RepID=A0A1J4J5H9_9EUKA|nr:hypothetical protein TRFO_39897 [Tritrichomonas foetus]|eukprot:OHS93929.1 hypothetical protein TRFO_39897 [Tritrichomonas foetus]